MSLPFLSQPSHISESQSSTQSPSQEQKLESSEPLPHQTPQESGIPAPCFSYHEKEQHFRQPDQQGESDGRPESNVESKQEPEPKPETEPRRDFYPERQQRVQHHGNRKKLGDPLHHQSIDAKHFPEERIQNLAFAVRPVTGDTLWHRQPPFNTGSAALNDALRSGLVQGRVIQLCGHTLSGKSMLAASFAANVLRDGGGVIWFETTNSPWEVETRISSLLGASTRDHIKSLPFVVFSVPTSNSAIYTLTAVHDDINLLRALPSSARDVPGDGWALRNALGRLRLVVFDSAASILSPLLGLRIPPAWSGHVALDHICAALRWFTVHTDATVVVTNRVVLSPGGIHPALGNKWASFVDVDALLFRDNSAFDQVRTVDESRSSTTLISVSVHSKRDRPHSCQIVLDSNGARNVPPDSP